MMREGAKFGVQDQMETVGNRKSDNGSNWRPKKGPLCEPSDHSHPLESTVTTTPSDMKSSPELVSHPSRTSLRKRGRKGQNDSRTLSPRSSVSLILPEINIAHQQRTSSTSISYLTTTLTNDIVNNEDYQLHPVSDTDTVEGISVKYGLKVSELKFINKLWANDSIHLRKTLIVPAGDRRVTTAYNNIPSPLLNPTRSPTYTYSPTLSECYTTPFIPTLTQRHASQPITKRELSETRDQSKSLQELLQAIDADVRGILTTLEEGNDGDHLLAPKLWNTRTAAESVEHNERPKSLYPPPRNSSLHPKPPSRVEKRNGPDFEQGKNISLVSRRTTRVKLVCEPGAFAAYAANVPRRVPFSGPASNGTGVAGPVFIFELTPLLLQYSQSVQQQVVENVNERLKTASFAKKSAPISKQGREDSTSAEELVSMVAISRSKWD